VGYEGKRGVCEQTDWTRFAHKKKGSNILDEIGEEYFLHGLLFNTWSSGSL
jgi:hypothetical protein